MNAEKKNTFHAFWDFLVLFSGISTASNLSRTQRRPVRSGGLFLFRNTHKTSQPARSASIAD